MPYCRECGAFMGEGDTYCKNCGQDVHVLTEEEYTIFTKREHSKNTETYSYGSSADYGISSSPTAKLMKKNFWLWFIGWFSWIGLVYYYWMNLSDLQILSTFERPEEVPSPIPPLALVSLTGISYVLIPLSVITYPIFNYFKFQRLHDYIHFHPIKQETIPRKGKEIAILNVLFYVFLVPAIIFLAMEWLFAGFPCLALAIIVGIIFVYWSYKWQKAMNERIDILSSEE